VTHRRKADTSGGAATVTTPHFRQLYWLGEALLQEPNLVQKVAVAGNHRDFSIRIQKVGASGSSPYAGVDVLLRTQDQSWQQTADPEGRVYFSALPCGGTVRIKLLTGEQPFRTLAFPCQAIPLEISAFVAHSCPARLQLMAKPADLLRPLSGKGTQRIRFKRCSAAAVIQGSFAEGGMDHYLLTAQKGQEMSLHVVAREEQSPVLFDVYWLRNPGVYLPALSAQAGCIANENVRDFKGILPESGDYVISVYAEGGNGPYFLDIIIQ
jgi:hypothetical protein